MTVMSWIIDKLTTLGFVVLSIILALWFASNIVSGISHPDPRVRYSFWVGIPGTIVITILGWLGWRKSLVPMGIATCLTIGIILAILI